MLGIARVPNVEKLAAGHERAHCELLLNVWHSVAKCG